MQEGKKQAMTEYRRQQTVGWQVRAMRLAWQHAGTVLVWTCGAAAAIAAVKLLDFMWK